MKQVLVSWMTSQMASLVNLVALVSFFGILGLRGVNISKVCHIQLDAKEDLLNGAHVCRHTEGAAAVSGDQDGEQA